MAGIYIHIPFCRQACTYCNFHFSTSLKQKEEFLLALKKEIELATDFDPVEMIETIYFGGGTPSILEPLEIEEILATIRHKFNVSDAAEITLEANPDDINASKLEGWKRSGVNRFSLGIQSFSDLELKWMNRAHNASQSLDSIGLIKGEGFDNFSVDLIYGSPLLSDEAWIDNIKTVVEQDIMHISCYALTVEPKTRLDHLIKTHTVQPVDTARQAAQFEIMVKMLTDAGYEHYEISNFARPGHRSKHNSSYWKGKPYYGFGPSAHSFNGFDVRRWNVANNALYIQSLMQHRISYEEEKLTELQRLNEYIMISIRTKEGLDLSRIEDSFGQLQQARIRNASKKYLDNALMTEHGGILTLTDQGKFLADGIAADLFA